MKKEVANLWIKALRSGKYKQGVCALHTSDNKYCCLGVLCDLYDKDRKTKKKKSIKISKPRYNGNKGKYCYRYGDEVDFLPTAVKRWAGMKSKKGSLEIDGDFFDLAVLNDGESYHGPMTFKEIAKIIETYVDIL